MDAEQISRLAYISSINARVMAKVALLNSMEAANAERDARGLALAYDEKSFLEVETEFDRLADLLRDA